EWGLLPEKIYYSRNGMPVSNIPAPRESKNPAAKIKFFFIGQISQHKGIQTLLEATKLLLPMAANKFEVHIHGFFQEKSFEEQVQPEIEMLQGTVFFHGAYRNHEVYDILRDADAI